MAENIDIAKVKENPNNPRFIKDEKYKKLVKSLKDFPEMTKVRPLICNSDMVILGGNMRLRAMKEAGWKKIPVEVVDWSEEKQQQFIIKDNLGYGEWDWDIIANEWDAEKVEEWGLELPDVSFKKEEAEEDDYEVSDEIKTDIVEGDLIEIGEHRLICGDSTDSDQVEKLLNGNNPNMMVTDPPYGVNYDPSWRADAGATKNKNKMGKVKNDHEADWSEAWSLFEGDVAYVYHAGAKASIVQNSLEKNDFIIRAQIIWAKDRMAMSRGDYHWQHEPLWYAVKKNGKGHRNDDRTQTTLWNIPSRDDNGHGHSTQKPIECMAKPIKNHTIEEVYDPFLGSGTTMVAAHQLDRKCYGMELDPKYCQVIIDRMLNTDENLTIKVNGEQYNPSQNAQQNPTE